MNKPIYYDDGETKIESVKLHGTTPAAQTRTPNILRPSTVISSDKKTQGLKTSGPFMQPDVFGIPQAEDLKETSTSTRSNAGTPGLTVPNR